MSPLSELLSKYAEYGNDGLLPAVDEIVQHGHLLEHLHNLVHGHANVVDETPHAYRHPNGFTKIRLVAAPSSRWTVRLHVWDELSRDSDVHSHRWNFASHIL